MKIKNFFTTALLSVVAVPAIASYDTAKNMGCFNCHGIDKPGTTGASFKSISNKYRYRDGEYSMAMVSRNYSVHRNLEKNQQMTFHEAVSISRWIKGLQ